MGPKAALHKGVYLVSVCLCLLCHFFT